MANHLELTVLSPQRILLADQQVEEVLLTGDEGQIEILPDHANMVGTLETGLFRYTSETQGVKYGFISNGFFEVSNGKVSVMAETLEMANEIDVARAKSAEQKAKQSLASKTLELDNFKKYQLKLERAIIRQQVAGKS